MVLLDVVVRLRRLKDLHIEACHVDHRLRDRSHEDAEFVVDRCRSYGILCHLYTLGPKPAQVNTEAWARDERYAVFRRVLSEQKLDRFLTAHTANDVAETLLMRLVANKELNSIEEHDPERGCLRPLLSVSREQIDDYVARRSVPFVEDPTNQDTAFTRNRIRREILPILEQQFDKALVWTLSERAQSLAADAKALRGWGRAEASKMGEFQPDNPEWLSRFVGALGALPSAVQWRLVEESLLSRVGYRVGERVASAVVHALLHGGAEVTVADGLVVRGSLFKGVSPRPKVVP